MNATLRLDFATAFATWTSSLWRHLGLAAVVSERVDLPALAVTGIQFAENVIIGEDAEVFA